MNRQRTRGFALLELIVALALLGLFVAFIGRYAVSQAERQRESLAALQAKRVLQAAGHYFRDHGELSQTGPIGVPAMITMAQLKAGRYLPSDTFAEQNPYGQTYMVHYVVRAPGEIDALLATRGGEQIAEGALRRIARQIGPEGGYITNLNPAVATGSYAGWQAPLATFGIGGSPVGTIVGSLTYADNRQVTDFIYRSAVAGKPELNAMATDLNMGHNRVTNVASVTAHGLIEANEIYASGRTYANEYIQISGVVDIGAGCTPNGLLGREPDGRLASCVGGAWRRAGL